MTRPGVTEALRAEMAEALARIWFGPKMADPWPPMVDAILSRLPSGAWPVVVTEEMVIAGHKAQQGCDVPALRDNAVRQPVFGIVHHEATEWYFRERRFSTFQAAKDAQQQEIVRAVLEAALAAAPKEVPEVRGKPEHLPPFDNHDRPCDHFIRDHAGQWHYINHAHTWQPCPPPFPDAPVRTAAGDALAQAANILLNRARLPDDSSYFLVHEVDRDILKDALAVYRAAAPEPWTREQVEGLVRAARELHETAVFHEIEFGKIATYADVEAAWLDELRTALRPFATIAEQDAPEPGKGAMELDPDNNEENRIGSVPQQETGKSAGVASAAPAAMNWQRLKERLDTRLNDYLCDMKPDHDDAITGFNEAWDVMRQLFAEFEGAPPSAYPAASTPQPGEAPAAGAPARRTAFDETSTYSWANNELLPPAGAPAPDPRLAVVCNTLADALRAMLDHYGPPKSVAELCDYPSKHPITLARIAISDLAAALAGGGE